MTEPTPLPASLPSLVRLLRQRAGLDYAGLAEALGLKERTPPTWETHEGHGRTIPTWALGRLLALAGEVEGGPTWAAALRLHAEATAPTMDAVSA